MTDLIEEIWAWVVVAEDGSEELLSDPSRGRTRPMLGVSREKAEGLLDLMDAAFAPKLRLVGFKRMETAP